VPVALIPDGTVLYQYAQYKKEYDDEWTGLACKVVAGDAEATEVINFKGYEDLTGKDSTGDNVAWEEQHVDDKVAVDP